MATTGKALSIAYPILSKMPAGTYFDTDQGEDFCWLSVQANTQAQVQVLRSCFPAAVWKRTWDDYSKWWTYQATCKGLHVKIYAVRENPATCKAITEKQVVTKTVAVAWEDEQVEQEVIVGWDCTNGADVEAPTAKTEED